MIKFNKFYTLFNIVSLILVIVSLAFLIFKGLNFGIDFKGGTLIELRSSDDKISVSSLRDNLNQMELGDVSVKKFGNDQGYLIKFENMNNSLKTPVKNFLNWEKKKGKDTFLVQPIDGEYIEFTWERVGNEARKMCNYINSLNLPKKSKIAILSKNCAHWIIADLAIMMSGNISVPIYANVNGDT